MFLSLELAEKRSTEDKSMNIDFFSHKLTYIKSNAHKAKKPKVSPTAKTPSNVNSCNHIYQRRRI